MENRQSLWQRTVQLPRWKPLPGDLDADTVVIGAGMAGLLTVYQLKRRGVNAVVLEANRVASGQTGRTTAKVTAQHDMLCEALIRRFGEARAMQYARANQLAIREYARIIREEDIDCGWHEAPAYLYTSASPEPLRREAETAARLGHDARFTTDTELPFRVSGAVRFDGQARFHPLKFLRKLTEGLEIYEDTRALRVDGGDVCTPRGTVHARRVVFACHYPFVNVPGWYFLRMHQERSYVLALENPWKPEGMYLGVDRDGLSFREAEGLLLMGGGGHRTGENSAGGRYDALRRQAHELVPQSREVACWSAQDCVTLDGVPYIGRFSPSAPQWYVATGFAKWGMTSSMVAALCLAGMLCDDPPEWSEVFSPDRFALSASAKNLATDTAQAVKGLARGLVSVPRAALDALPAGHGGIVEVDGRVAGVYKEESGRCHVVDPHCPHLGCQLEWNPDERSWDCPCHGSRFHYDGSLIDNPAQTDLRV